MLVNLTCGRNPWKRASFDDSTFRAFMKDPKFLRSILPISYELDAILRRIFEFNPANRATIPEIREMIIRCSGFAASKSPVSTPLPSPPFSPVDYTRDAAFNACYQVPVVPSVAPLPSPVYSPAPFQHSPSSGSSNSDNESVFSSCSSASSASSTSSYHNVAPAQTHKFSSRVPQPTYVSPPPPANTWFQPFIQAANLVKHVSFQPSMMAQPVHVY
jgi:serine/threonine protein kinase